jgi:hypothetical protein
MTGVSEAGSILRLVTTLGPVSTLIIVGVCMFFILRELKKQTSDLQKGLAESKKQSDEADAKIMDQIKELNQKVDAIKDDAVLKEQYYRDWGGWRTEFDNLRSLIIGIYKQGANNGNKG